MPDVMEQESVFLASLRELEQARRREVTGFTGVAFKANGVDLWGRVYQPVAREQVAEQLEELKRFYLQR